MHEIAPNGIVVRSMVDQTERDPSLMESLYEAIRVVCDGRTGTAYAVSAFKGVVRAIDIETSVTRWTSRIQGFRENAVIAAVEPAPMEQSGSAKSLWHEAIAIYPINERLILIQLAKGIRGKLGSVIDRTLVLDRSRGTVLSELPGLQRVVGATASEFFVVSGESRDSLWRVPFTVVR
jgi:hypothetical protein